MAKANVHHHLTDESCLDCPSSSSSSTPATSNPSHPPAQSSTTAASSTTAQSRHADIQPPSHLKPSITIEFCDRCRWAPRATWSQTELFLTFPTPLIRSITLQPLDAPETGGRFRVWLDMGNGDELVWDRKIEGGFPDLKVLKQRVRNLVQPEMGLGHSDVHGKEGRAVVGGNGDVTSAVKADGWTG